MILVVFHFIIFFERYLCNNEEGLNGIRDFHLSTSYELNVHFCEKCASFRDVRSTGYRLLTYSLAIAKLKISDMTCAIVSLFALKLCASLL